MLSLALAGFIWQLIYSRDQGLLNAALGLEGTERIDWYGDQSVNIWAVLVAASWRHVGYIMLLYLAGLKSVDLALKEAAAVDGASESRTFFSVVFPTLAPINIVVLVITVIESLRAFDLVWVINKGRNGLELLSALVTTNIIGEASLVGFGSAIATILLFISLVFIVLVPRQHPPGGTTMSTSTSSSTTTPGRSRTGADAPGSVSGSRKKPVTARRVLLYVTLVVVALVWLFPVVWAVYNSFRDYGYTALNGYVSFGGFTLDNYSRRLGAGRLRPVLRQHADHRGAVGLLHPVPVLDGRRSCWRGTRGSSTSRCSSSSPRRTCCPSSRC